MVYVKFLFSHLKSDINLARQSFFGMMKLGTANSLQLIFVSMPMATSLSKYFFKLVYV